MAGVRFLLGIPFRSALYIVTTPLAGAFGGLLASAILKLDSFGNLHRWRMIFAIEGIITIGLGRVALFTVTDRPETARWLTPDETEMATARVKSERVGQTVVLDRIETKKLVRGIFSPVTLST
ncbi:MFS transporter [Metarhizium acridum CQMa 102]|uniref:MFS transporter n=1 Tax=Metarhizium acridum (strain CQMa 102) TaxID=655827 RepID=E9E4G2_METAQ|nr:MFS transporter [Metarhizium acridum CQMa 102]EFY89173.1 MFS transporter [Metarhizium acridum CQMa 102]